MTHEILEVYIKNNISEISTVDRAWKYISSTHSHLSFTCSGGEKTRPATVTLDVSIDSVDRIHSAMNPIEESLSSPEIRFCPLCGEKIILEDK